MATGTPIRIARPVTQILPTIIGRMPKMLFPGFHTVPVKNFSGPIFKNSRNAIHEQENADQCNSQYGAARRNQEYKFHDRFS